MNALILTLAHTMNSAESWGVFLGFLALIVLFSLLLKGVCLVRKPEVIRQDSPSLWVSSPLFAEKRRKAAAAAYIRHSLTQPKEPSNEKR